MSEKVEAARTLALEAAMQWMFYRLVSMSAAPDQLVEEFRDHIQAQVRVTHSYGEAKFAEGRRDEYLDAAYGVIALHELRESLLGSVEITH